WQWMPSLGVHWLLALSTIPLLIFALICPVSRVLIRLEPRPSYVIGVHWLLALFTIPLLIFALICPWLPESARFHVASGQPDKALATLEQIARDNGRPMLLGRLVCDDAVGVGRRGRLAHLLIPQLRNTSLLLWVIWMSCAFCYYGLVLMTTELFETTSDGSIETCAAECRPLRTTDYMDLLWTTLAEFPGIFATIFIIEKFGRKKTMAFQFVIFAVCICGLIFTTENRTFLTCILFVARGIIAGLFQAAYVYTPEVYPTALRSTAVGACSGVARLGAMITPYVAQVLLKTSISTATAVYASAAIVAAFACLALPIETKGREMRDTVGPR
ncbi:hypothetical protein JYU34_008444, partial [Plutella xylostella]